MLKQVPKMSDEAWTDGCHQYHQHWIEEQEQEQTDELLGQREVQTDERVESIRLACSDWADPWVEEDQPSHQRAHDDDYLQQHQRIHQNRDGDHPYH